MYDCIAVECVMNDSVQRSAGRTLVAVIVIALSVVSFLIPGAVAIAQLLDTNEDAHARRVMFYVKRYPVALITPPVCALLEVAITLLDVIKRRRWLKRPALLAVMVIVFNIGAVSWYWIRDLTAVKRTSEP